MNICALYYNGFCEFELVFTAGLFKEHLTTVSCADKVYISEEGLGYLELSLKLGEIMGVQDKDNHAGQYYQWLKKMWDH